MLSSETLDDLAARGSAPSGVHYCLPSQIIEFVLSPIPARRNSSYLKGHFARSVTRAAATTSIIVLAPQYNDNITIDVSTRGYLKSISLVTKDELVEVIKHLAKAFGALGGLEAAHTRVTNDEIAREWVDPTDADALAGVEAKFNRSLRGYAEAKRKTTCTAAGQAAQPQNGITIPDLKSQTLCIEYERFATMKKPLTLRFNRFTPGEGWPPSSARDPQSYKTWVTEAKAETVASEADCRVGICYRVPEPWVLTVAVSAKPT